MKTAFTLFLLTLSIFSFAQQSKIKVVPQDDQEFTGDKIIKNLVKSGVKILDVKTNFSSTSHVLGFFHDPANYMGISQGLILSTGIVDNLTKASSSENYTSIEIEDTTTKKIIINSILSDSFHHQTQIVNSLDISAFAKAGDEDLSNEINGLRTFDARIIEVSFIPSADTLYYRYIFASEEYDEFVCSDYNDIFAFYLTEGKNNKKRNIALVPNKQLPVSINTINNGNPQNTECKKSNAHLYQRNNGNQNLLFDGFTKVLDIREKVIPGKTYHLKIAIADASDSVWDSAVMIENGSIFSYFNSFELNFGVNSSVIENQKTIEEILKSLKNHPESNVQLIGHSDLSGNAKYNLELSKQRVENLRNYLIEKGIDKVRIIEAYKGETMPRYEEAAKNRRVEIFVLGN